MRRLAFVCLIAVAAAIRIQNNSNDSINHVGFGKNQTHYFDKTANERNSSTYTETLHKTGFYYVDCLKDDMEVSGDKHGFNKDRFRESHPISIVRYDVNTPKEDREKMTPEVCYDFCRRTPGAVFFGLSAGRDCYCTPYFSRMAGDSSDCDAPCDGDASRMCGGMKKSAIYSMHECEGGVLGVLNEEKEDARDDATDVQHLCGNVSDHFAGQWQGLNDCKAMTKCFASAGDSLTSHLMQASCDVALTNSKMKQVATQFDTSLTNLLAKADLIDVSDSRGADPSANDLVKLEGLIFDLEKKIGAAQNACRHFNKTFKQHHDGLANKSDLGMFYPITHFVERDNPAFGPSFNDSVPSTCRGPLTGGAHRVQHLDTLAECATACDEVHGEEHCLAFVYQSGQNGGKCFLLSDIEEIGHYEKPDDCAAPGSHIVCGAKFASMKGFELRLTSKEAGVDHVAVDVFKQCVPDQCDGPLLEFEYEYSETYGYYGVSSQGFDQ